MTVYSRTWFGGVVDAREYASHGRFRPEVAAWLDPFGSVVALRLAPPGEGNRALLEALGDALPNARARGECPTRLSLVDPALAMSVSESGAGLPIEVEPHSSFEIRLRDLLSECPPNGLGYSAGYVAHGISAELVRELFAATHSFLALGLLNPSMPRLCSVSVRSHGYDRAVAWIGEEEAFLGRGLYLFRDITQYRDFMHVRVLSDREWSPDHDASVLGWYCEHVRWLHKPCAHDVRRLRLPLHPPGLAPVIVATDADDVQRPYGPDDLERITLVTQALTAAFASGRDGSFEVRANGATHRAEVVRVHPEASEEDMQLLLADDECDLDLDFDLDLVEDGELN